MTTAERLRLLGCIALPLLMALVLHLAPRPWVAAQAMDAARLAQADDSRLALAVHLKTAVAQYPWRADLWEAKGRSELALDDPLGARVSFAWARATGELSPSGQLALGDTYQKTGELPEAIHTWQDLLERSGPSAEIFDRLSRAHQQTGDYAQVLADLQAWAELAPQDGEVAYRLALVQAIYQPEAALDTLLKAGELDPAAASAARQVREALIVGAEQDSRTYQLVLVGRVLGLLGEWPLAEASFNQAVQADPAYAEAWAFLGEARQQNGGDGEAALQRAAALAPDSLVVQALQALSWRRQGRLDQALVVLHTIADRDGSNALWQAELGNTLAQMGDLPSALRYFQKAVEVAPQNPVYWRSLAAFCIRYGIAIPETGLDAARQAVALAPDDPQSLDLLAQVMMVLNDLISARRFLERALAVQPDYTLASLHMGQVLLELGEREPAFQALMSAIRSGGTQPAAVQAKRVLAQNFPAAP